VTLYMDDDTLARMREAAESAGVSMSAWLSLLVRERTQREWPAAVIGLAGAWGDIPTAEEVRAGSGADTERESL
jgi:hypothetical protein